MLLKPCSPQVGEDQQPTSGAGHERHWIRHRGPTMHHASRSHAGGVRPRRWGWLCPRCRAAGQSTPQPYTFVPFPRLRPDRPVAPDLDVRPTSHPVSVPSLTRESASQSQQRPRICAGQVASEVTKQPASVSLKATVRGSSPWRRTPISPAQARCTARPSSFTGAVGARLGHMRMGQDARPSSNRPTGSTRQPSACMASRRSAPAPPWPGEQMAGQVSL